MSFRIIVKIMR